MVSALFLIIFFLVSFLIVGLVLLQEGKGGGLTGMSTGMDGVMGAKNPLRRMTAYLFVIFVLLAITINWYFHQRGETSLPESAVMPDLTRVLEETVPLGGTTVVEPGSGGSLRPEAPAPTTAEAPAAPIPPDVESMPPAPANPVTPPAGSGSPDEAAREEIGESAEQVREDVQDPLEEIGAEHTLRPETTEPAEAAAAPVAPPAGGEAPARAESEPVTPATE